MNWTEIAKQGVIAIIVAIAVWVMAGDYWKSKIENAPVSRDTVMVHDAVKVVAEVPARLLPDPRIDSILFSIGTDSVSLISRDSLVRDLAQIANLDTTIADTRIEVSYIPLDHRFKLSVTPPPRIEITNTKLVYSEPHWVQYALFGASALVTGWGIADDNPWMVGGGLVGVTIVSITF